MAPVPKVLMISYCQGKGTEDFSRPADLGKLHRGCDFSRPGNYHCEETYLCLATHSYSDELVLGRVQYSLHKFDA